MNMSQKWKYQLRIRMSENIAQLARQTPDDPTLKPLVDVLEKHGARLQNQFDAFAAYVAQAEQNNATDDALYKWTKATIENPLKEAKYLTAFTLYVDGEEVYERAKADRLETDMRPLVGGELVQSMTRHDTNPANNPQPPKRYRS